MLQGRMDEARHLLSKEASANPTSMNMYKILDDLMKKMPVPSVCTKCGFFMQCVGKSHPVVSLLTVCSPLEHLSLTPSQ